MQCDTFWKALCKTVGVRLKCRCVAVNNRSAQMSPSTKGQWPLNVPV